MLLLEISRSYNICAVMYGTFVSGMTMSVMFDVYGGRWREVPCGRGHTIGILSSRYWGGIMHFHSDDFQASAVMSIPSTLQVVFPLNEPQPKYPIPFGTSILPISLGLVERAMGTNNQSQVNGHDYLLSVSTWLTKP